MDAGFRKKIMLKKAGGLTPFQCALRLAVQDIALSRREHGFESRRARHSRNRFGGSLIYAPRLFALKRCYAYARRARKAGPARAGALRRLLAEHPPPMLLALFRGASSSSDRSHVAVGATWAERRHGIEVE